jgi:hypothetical protein
MVKVVITHPGDVVVDEFEAWVEQPTLPPLAEPPTIGLVEIATSQPTDSAADILAKLLTVDGAGSGLDADFLDGQHGAYYLPAASYTAADVLAKLITVDGSGSGLDADLLDGQNGSYYTSLSNQSGVISPSQHGNQGGGTLHALVDNSGTNGFMAWPDKAKLDGIEQNATADQTPAEILTAIKTVDGSTSGLDADLLDGQDGAYYLALANGTGSISDTQHGNRGGGALHALATAVVAGFLLDAPSDGTSYARRNAAWIATSAFIDAPSDGSFYGRVNGAWSAQYTKAALDTLLAAKVAGPATSTDNALVRFDLATGKLVQNSGAILDDSNNLSGIGAFTTTGQINAGTNVIASATVQAGSGIFQALNTGNAAPAVLTNATAGNIFLRPNGYASGTGQLILDTSGNCSAAGQVIAGTSLQAGNGFFVGVGASVFFGNASGASTLYFRPNGVSASAAGQMSIDSSGNMLVAGQVNPANVVETQSNATMILSVTAGATGTIYLRPDGSGTTSMQSTYNDSGNFNIAGPSGVKSTGTTWANPSDERIKEVVGDYEVGLDAILALQVRRFTYKGNETPTLDDENDPAFAFAMRARTKENAPYHDSPHYKLAVDGTEVAGLVAQEAEKVMPSLVTQHRMLIDGVEVTDFRILDAGDITWALVNAVKTLAARVEALEAGG